MDEKRCVTVTRKTGETDITIKLNLDGSWEKQGFRPVLAFLIIC